MSKIKAYLWIGGITTAFVAAGIALAIFGPKPKQSWELWDARFVETPGNYRDRFISGAVSPTPPAAGPITVTPIPGDDPGTASFRISGAPENNDDFCPPGEVVRVDATAPVTFSDGSSLKLVALLGLAKKSPNNYEQVRFLWAIGADGKTIPETQAVKAGWVPNYLNKAFELCVVFEKRGVARPTCGVLADSATGKQPGFGVMNETGKCVYFHVPAMRLNTGHDTLLFTAFGGTPEIIELPTRPGATQTLNGDIITFLGNFPVAPQQYWSHLKLSDHRLVSSSLMKEQMIPGTAYFVSLPEQSNSHRYDILPVTENSRDICAIAQPGVKAMYAPDEGKIPSTLKIRRLPEVKRVVMTLPPHPGFVPASSGDDPLDWEIPPHWRHDGTPIWQAMHALISTRHASLVKANELKLSEFPDKKTMREVLATALAADLEVGYDLKIDRASRVFHLEEPPPPWWRRAYEWTKDRWDEL